MRVRWRAKRDGGIVVGAIHAACGISPVFALVAKETLIHRYAVPLPPRGRQADIGTPKYRPLF